MFPFFQAYVRHPEIVSTKHNRDFVLKQINDAVNAISGVAQSVGDSEPSPFEQAGALAKALSAMLVSDYTWITSIYCRIVIRLKYQYLWKLFKV